METSVNSDAPKASTSGDDTFGCVVVLLVVVSVVGLAVVGGIHLWETHGPGAQAAAPPVETPMELCKKALIFPGIRTEDRSLLLAMNEARWSAWRDFNAQRLKGSEEMAQGLKDGTLDLALVTQKLDAERQAYEEGRQSYKATLESFCVGAVQRRNRDAR